MTTRNPGTNPGNGDRLRVLENEVRRLQLTQNNMLGMLQRYQRFGGGGGGINIIVARVQENVDHTMDTFAATIAKVILGTADAIDTEITVENLDSGLIDEAAVGNIEGEYRAVGTTGEEVFILLKGMTIYCLQGNDSKWYVVQSGGAFNETAPSSP
jgi:hypothetical protein